ncbi:MAG: LytTR family transcriptional regulator [Bacteroidales bacterium]|nr:LytTR family transcriptional regulator [Bacteroidales bacterium]
MRSTFKISIRTNKGIKIIESKEILYCQADGRYTRIHLQTGESYLIAKVLKKFEEFLCPDTFYRIHQSYLINVKCIKEYLIGDGRRVVLKDDTELSVSQRKYKGFTDRLLEYFPSV